jgi:photoactive yellow protein
MNTQFEESNLLSTLHALDDGQLDLLNFGVIAFDGDIVVKRYNLNESQATGVKPERVIGSQLFTEVAQCMNNFMVAQRFLDARESASPLDETIDFVLTWRMRPTPVKLRLLSNPDIALQYLLFKRAA